METKMLYEIKGACSDSQPHPQIFQTYGDFVPKVESYLEGFVCKCHVHSV